MIQLAINGANGRMGARLCKMAALDERFELVARIARSTADSVQIESLDALIDVSSDTGAQRALDHAIQHRAAVLVATTGLSSDCLQLAHRASEHVAVMIAPNTSVGVAVMKYLAVIAARLLDEAFGISLVEFHHAAKLDVLSGTAHAIRDEIERKTNRKIILENFCGIRVGDHAGEHFLRFSGPSESIEIIHRAHDRDLFVRGALLACAWLADQSPGMYSIEDAFGIGVL